MFLIYNLLLAVFSPIWIPWMWLRTRKRREAPNWQERMGNVPLQPRKDGKRIWFHAVSVGEVVAALPVLRETKRRLPNVEIVLSVTTSSGHKTATDLASEIVDHLIYMPMDITRFQLSAMQKIRPDVLAIFETELWMNLLWAAKVFDVKTLLLNGRISDRSFRRSKWVKPFYSAMLRNMDLCLMQTERDAERIRALGAKDARVLGNCKFDQAAEGLDSDPATLRSELGFSPDIPILIVGSTRSKEEELLVLDAVENIGLSQLAVVHAPRHLERAEDLYREACKRFAKVGLRSQKTTGNYLILDTYGELSKFYAIANFVVIGGGFENHGGQNLLQPLAHGKPVIHGPHMQNFADVVSAARAAGATETCGNAHELAHILNTWLDRPEIPIAMGAKAKAFVAENLGASDRYVDAIVAAIDA